MKAISNPRTRANSSGIQPKIAEVKLNKDPNKKKEKAVPKKLQRKNTILKNLEGTIEERTKNIQNINEMSIENFRNKIFNKKKDKNISDNPFEDIKKFDSTDTSKNFPEKINRLIKYGSPILWKRNSKKKDLEKIYKMTGFTTDFKGEKNPEHIHTSSNNISNISHKDSFSYNKLLYWKNSINRLEKNDNENSMLKEEIIFTNQSNLEELNNNDVVNHSNYITIKEDPCNYSKLEVDRQAYKQFKEELNNEFFVSANVNNINNYNYNNKSRFLRSIEKANTSKLNSSSIFNNKENLNLSNLYPSLNQNFIVNNANNNMNMNYHNNNNYFQSINSPKFIKEGKDIKFDSTLNSFKDLKNIHESVILYGEYQENIMTTTVNDIKFIDLINRNKCYISELIQFTENLPAINDNINVPNYNNNNNYFNTNQTIDESIEHVLPENDDKISFSPEKHKENFPLVTDFRMTKSKSQTNFYRKSLNSPSMQSKLKKKKFSFLLNSLSSNHNSNNNININNNKSSIIINSSSSGNNENSLSNRSIMKSKGMPKKSSKVKFIGEETNSKGLLNLKPNKKDDVFGIKINWKIAEIINETKDYSLYKIFDTNNSSTFLVRKYNLNIKIRIHPLIGAHNRYSKSINHLEHLYNLNTNSHSNSNNSNSNNSNNMSNSNKSINAKNYSFNKTISEFEAFREYDHKNIIKLVDYEVTETNCFLYFEYVPGKSLKNVLETYGGLSEQIIKKYLKSIIEGIVYLHKKDIKLKNLKSSNILIELNGNVKLTDFLDYKSIIEFYEIYENSNFKNLRNSEKFLKYPFPWMLKSKSYFYSENEFDLKNEMDANENISLKFLAFLMLEMHTGSNAGYLEENFSNYKEGKYENEAIGSKSFAFSPGISEEFIDLFYGFCEENVSVKVLEEEILKHDFFNLHIAKII